jgi:cyclic pyranopterin phosphate synthase
LKPDVYDKITRGGDITAVLRGIDKALEVGFPVKINTVLIEGVNSGEAERFVDFALSKGVEVRFIERMSFEDNDPFVAQDAVLSVLARRLDISNLPVEPRSPHVRLFDCGGARIGFISPRSRPFCDGCNKLRLTPNGRLKMCLASEDCVDIRAVLRKPHTDNDVAKSIKRAVSLKPKTGPWTAHAEMWRVGG